ncbi:MAG: YdeI/OmpD-associated family protein [Actinomycetota bacterium]
MAKSADPESGLDFPVKTFHDAGAWAKWLDSNHAKPGLWLRIAKKGSGEKTPSFAEAVEVALCYGWIDSRGKSGGPDFTLGRFTPRSKRSIWSKINREKALELIREGRMRPPGLAEVERAEEDGRWDRAYDPPSRSTVPPDLQTALDRNAKAKKAFAGLNGTNRYAILFRIQTAKKEETRAKRIKEFVAMLARGDKPYP